MKPFEEKIVKLTLDYNSFKTNAAAAVGVMTKLKESIANLGKGDAKGASTAIKEIGDATKVVDSGLETMAETTKKTSLAFQALKTMATGALLGIGNQLMNSVVSTLKKFTLDPVTDGFKEYELKMKSMQTIMTNSGESVEVVNGILNDLNKYSDLTIYNFNDMTKAIGSLSTSGIGLNDASSAVKGFFNLAAGTGVEAARASSLLDTAMVQAIQIGKMDYQNWKQLQSAGMGGPKFRDALVANAQAMGKQIDLSDGFNESLKQGWATTDVMLATLKQFEQDQSLLEAATKVRTFTQLMDTALESVGSGWAQTWEIIFGDFNEATTLWSGVWNVLSPILDLTADIRNGFLNIFKDNGGIQAIVQTFGNVYRFINQIAQAIGGGFTNSMGRLMDFLKAIPVALTYPFKLLELLTRKIADIKIIPQVIGAIFQGLFSILGLFASLILGIVDKVKDLYNWFGLLGNKTMSWVKSLGNSAVFKPFIDFFNTLKGIKWSDLLPKENPFTGFLKTAKAALDPLLSVFDNVLNMFKVFGKSISTLSTQPIKDWAKNSKEAMLSSFTEARAKIKELFTATFWKSLFADFKSAFNETIKGIQESSVLTTLSSSFESLKSAVSKFKLPNFGEVGKLFKGVNLDWLINAFKPVTVYADEVTESIKKSTNNFKWFNDVVDKSASILQKFQIAVGEKLTNSLDKAKTTLDSIKPKIQEFVQQFSSDNIVATIRGWVNSVKEFNSGLDWSPIIRQIKDVQDAYGAFKDKLSFYFDVISAFDVFKLLQNGIQMVIDLIGSFNKTNINKVVHNGLESLGNIADSTKSKMEVFSDFMKNVFSKLGDWIVAGIKYSIEGLGLLWNGTKSVLSKIGTFLGNYKENFNKVVDFFTSWKNKIKTIFGDTFSTENLIRGGILAYIGLMIKGMYDFQKNSNGILGGIKEFIEGFTDLPGAITKVIESLTGFTKSITPGNILKIAGAIAILALSLKLLSTIDGEKLNSTLIYLGSGIGAMLTLFGALAIVNKLDLGGGMLKSMATITTISTALLIMAGALKLLSTIDAEQMDAALVALASTLTMVIASMIILSKMNATQVSISLKGILGVASAVLLLAKAVEAFAALDTRQLLVGGAATATALLALATAMKIMGNTKFGVRNGVGVILLATALKMLVKPVKELGSLPWDELKQGMLALAGIMATITAPLLLLGSSKFATSSSKILGAALAMDMVAGALVVLLIPMKVLGAMDKESIIKGLFTIVGLLTGITVALSILGGNGGGAMLGATSILITAGALNALVIPLTIFGTLKLSTIAQGLTVLAISLGLIVAAGYLAIGAAPGLLAIAGAVGALAIAGIAIGAALMAIVVVLEFFTSATKDSFDTLSENILHMFDVILGALPKFEEVAIAVIDSMLTVLETNTGRFITAGFNILISLLQGIRDNMYEIVDLTTQIIVEFAAGLTANIEPLINASLELAIALIKGLAQGINDNSEEFMEAVRQLMGAVLLVVVDGLELVATTFFGWIPGIKGIAEEAGAAARDGIREHFNLESGTETANTAMDGVTGGVTNKTPELGTAGKKAADWLNENFGLPDYSGTGTDAADDFISSVRNKEGEAGGAGRVIGDTANQEMSSPDYAGTGTGAGTDYSTGISGTAGHASTEASGVASKAKAGFESVDTSSSGEYFGQGFVNGIGSLVERAKSAASNLASKALSSLRATLAEQSPSKETTQSGEYFGQGLINGIMNMVRNVELAAVKMGSFALDALDSAIYNSVPRLEGLINDNLNLTPKIIPELDMSNMAMDEFSRTYKAFSNTAYIPTNNPQKSTEGKIGNSNTYNLHIHANGELPDNVIKRMALRFDQAIREQTEQDNFNSGEVYV